MAREERDREDLLGEAVGLVERAELHVAGEPAPVVVGFRRTGCCSLYFGGDPVYQFNRNGALRRAFVDGKLLKADAGRLIELVRVRTADETQLVPTETDDRTGEHLNKMARRLAMLYDALAVGRFEVVGRVPVDADPVARLAEVLPTLTARPRAAPSPHAR